MTHISICFVFAIAACGGSPHPVAGPTTNPTAPAAPASDVGRATAAPPAPTAGVWIYDAAMCANHPDELGAWNLTQDQMRKRYGTGVAGLASIPTTKEHPIELCGVRAENIWLASSTCADGSHPYSGPEAVESSRAGNAGAGGRCQGIIDLYEAKCPEKTYEVYVDMNLCGPGESFM
jgi:hypothetical protein